MENCDPGALQWIQNVVTCLGLSEEAFNSMLTNEKSEMERKSLAYFLGKEAEIGDVLFVYSSNEEIDVEVERTEEVEVLISEETNGGSNFVGGENHLENQETTFVEGMESLDSNITGGEDILNDGSDMTKQPPAKKNTQLITKKITIKESQIRCHICLNHLPEGLSDVLYIYLVRSTTGKIATTEGVADEVLPEAIEVGFSTEDLLSNLNCILRYVYIPLLDPSLPDTIPSSNPSLVSDSESLKVADLMKTEFRSSLHKFCGQIAHSIQQVKGDIQLHVPSIVIERPELIIEDYEVTNQLELALEEWSKAVASVVEKEAKKTPLGKGPLAEIDFWRERNATLSTIYEQINMKNVQQILNALEKLEANMIPTFRYHFSELSKLYVEAKDNVKFLTTLERHFKNIATGSFSTIVDTLPSMMNAIRMVWIVSRHYNTDERMVPLMERIASTIADKVSMEIDIRSILQKSPEIALQTIEDAKLVLEMWHSTYMKVRERIESSGTDHRWEFDRKRLFEQTNYMAKICENLEEVATVLDQFHKFLGPELNAVTGNSQGIDEIMDRVESLREPLESIPFDIFERGYKISWDGVMMHFRERVSEIESMTRKFIDTSFQKLRSAEGAFDLLQNFQNIQSRESINKQMMEKYKDILMQYTKELEVLEELFLKHKDQPPLYKNYPPVAGAISWARALYHNAKKPIIRFRAMNDLLKSSLGEEVKERYLVFARTIDAYIKDLFNQWQDTVPSITSEHLKKPILGPPISSLPRQQQPTTTNNQHPSQTSTTSTVVLPNPPYYPNFSNELSMIIRESKYLDRMGFKIPETALNVTLQEDKYHEFVRGLTLMLKHYDTLLNDLTPVETHLLQSQLSDLRKTLQVGFTPLNWNSQRIPLYIESCNKALNEFNGIVSQIHKSSTMIEEVIECIENTLVIMESDFEKGTVLEINEFYELIERNRLARVEVLVRKYRSIGPLLIKVEEIVAGVNTGGSPKLAIYYKYWEKRIFNAITKMIIGSMATFQALINVIPPNPLARERMNENDMGYLNNNDQKWKRPPLCKVKATMNGKDIVVTPTLPDIYKYLSKAVKHIVESAKMFYRWMHGTCWETEPQIVMEEEEPVIFSFYSDICQNPHVIKMMLSLNQAIHKVFSIVNKYLDSWRRYDTVYLLWNQKRRMALEKLPEKNPSCVYFDARLASYARLVETVKAQPVEKDIDFIRIDCTPIAIAIANQADSWKLDYGKILTQLSQEILQETSTTMDKLMENLSIEPQDLDTLKFVLNTIQSIEIESMDMELVYTDVIERYRTLRDYGIPVDTKEDEMAQNLEKRWKQIIVDSKTKDLRLVKVKKQFQEVTRKESIEFKERCNALKADFFQSGPGSSQIDLDQGVEKVLEYKKICNEYHTLRQDLVNAENLFCLPITSFPELNEVKSELDKLSLVYDLYQEQKEFVSTTSNILWCNLDVNSILKGIDELLKKSRKFPKELRGLSTFQQVEHQIEMFKDGIPLIQNIKNEAMKPRHWEKLMHLTGVEFEMNFKTLTLANIFSMNLHRFSDILNEIVGEAMQEQKIENELKKMEDVWNTTVFDLSKYKKNGEDRGWILRSADEIQLLLEDHMLNLQTMATSRFIGSFTEVVRGWEKKLNHVHECIDVLFCVQRKWMYLESIFIGADDIRLQLPEEAKRFDAIDKNWKTIMNTTSKSPGVVNVCMTENQMETLKNLSERLDRCQKSLSDYLDTKRNHFPRFFFISDDELLSVLGNSDPTCIQNHLLKLFDNVKYLKFGKSNRLVLGIESSENESFELKTFVHVEGPVETWMTSVEEEMRLTLHGISKEGVFHYAKKLRTQWLNEVLGMVGLVGSQIWWTWEVEDVFRRVRNGNKYAMKDLEKKLTQQLNELVGIVRTPLSNTSRKKVNTLLIIDVHARDIVASFVRDSILGEKEFAWESQLRFYWDKEADDIIIRQCTGVFRYGYEYMGLNGRLVITPLTDRCYMTLTQALTFKLGGSPAGPAGTGKTETVKDLAKSLALPCYVINCGEGLDYKAMGGIFSGLVQVGAWGCFDEFNRINVEVLSVVSAQLRAIQNALNYDKATVDIGLGGEIAIRRTAGFATCGMFITMNPGYAGRTELPDNLKALFRPVTMIVPDLLQICQIMLFSEGFEKAVVLSKKMTVLYKLSKEQLSKQYHYDFGLRALKSVLVMAGSLKREYSSMSEELVLMRALRDSNMPKFVYEDVPLFRGLINDLFPNLDCPRVGYLSLKEAIENDLIAKHYKPHHEDVFKEQVDKIIQMYETMLVRHTTMIVGPTNGGKSLVLDTLSRASLPALELSVKMFVLNPKAQSVAELYGTMDPSTRDWTDGVLSKLFRDLNQPLPQGKLNEKRWLIFDGDVDAVWVENMNSVMDDNRLLTLPNGERIRLQEHCSMICETFDLQYASPATISRCGMVWVDPKNLGYSPYFERWLKVRYSSHSGITSSNTSSNNGEQEEKEFLSLLFDKYVPSCMNYVLEGIQGNTILAEKLKQIIPISNMEICRQLCSLLESFLPLNEPTGNPMERGDLEGIFIFSLLWSCGAALVDTSRIKFDLFLKSLANISLPNESLYQMYYNLETHRWKSWDSEVSVYQEPSPFVFYKIHVPTMDSVLYTFLLSNMVKVSKKPVLFVGESGTAKTITIQNFLQSLDSTTTNTLTMNFSSRTNSLNVQNNIEANVDKRSGKFYGPPAGKSLVVFIDDMNMPRVDSYGTQQPIALLHFLMGKQSMYDRGKDLDIRILKDLQYVAAMGPPGGGRSKVDTRFIALFNVFNLNSPSSLVLTRIYSSILTSYFREFNESVRETASKLTKCLLELYNHILEQLPPTPAKFHYIFNLRDLRKICEGICLATPDKIDTSTKLVRLWRNEILGVFSDRLIHQHDREIVDEMIKTIVVENFPREAEMTLMNPILFGDYKYCITRLNGGCEEDPCLYEDLGDYVHLRQIFDEVLETYNMDHKPMTLVLFQVALSHLSRILRIIKNPLGNALLIGVGGSGKKSLTKLATFTAGYEFFEISLSRGYGEMEFREDLKNLYRLLGNQTIVFLFTDAHIVQESFLEFINNMLITGMIPTLYEKDEKDSLCSSVREEVKANGIVETNENCWTYYIQKCRQNLHVVLAMSPSGNNLRIRSRAFPALVTATTMDWFFPWPEDALRKVAESFLAEEDSLSSEYLPEITNHLVHAHQQVIQYAEKFETELRRYYYVTPKNYLDLIVNYRVQIKENNQKVAASIQRLEGGLSKLVEAAEAVDKMQAELSKKKVIVDEKTIACESLIATIAEKSTTAKSQQEAASIKQVECEKAAEQIMKEKETADVALMEALPAVEAAAAALQDLSKADLTELKAFSSPPPLVKAVCLCVLHLKPTGQELEDWKGAKVMLSNPNLLQLMQNYDKDKITPKMISKIKTYFKSPDLTIENMKHTSKAGAGLLVWVIAIVKYYDVAKNVEPLKLKVKQMEKEQGIMEQELSQLTETLARLKTELEELSFSFNEANEELQSLKRQADTMQKRLQAASKLLLGLGSERQRWTEDVIALRAQGEKLTGDCLLAASFLSYAGAFSFDYRFEMLYKDFYQDIHQRQLPITENVKLEHLLSSDAVIQKWVAEGLPRDEHSVQNGILTMKSSRFPLCIDPQQQAVNWIKRKEEKNNLTVKTFNDSDFMKHLELALQFGNPFLFESVDEEIDPILDPILEKHTFMVGGKKMIKLGDKTVDWDDNFRLYFTSKLANPHFSPEIMGKTMIINYNVTQDGLANQLLNVVVAHERPDLEEQYSALVDEMSENTQMIVELEDTLLRELSSSKGNILDNEELIATLDETKSKAIEIGGKLEQSKFTTDEISKTRGVYNSVAVRGSIMYFAMAGLSIIMKMYEISLSSFLGVFNTSLDRAKRDVVLENRLRSMIHSVTSMLYDYTCTGIFERHKLMFSFQITCMIMKGNQELNRMELDFFLRGDVSLEATSLAKPSHLEWISLSGWRDLLCLSTLNHDFVDVVQDVLKSSEEWKQWYDQETPEKSNLPMNYSTKLNSFQQLLLYRCFRQDRVYNAIKSFVMEKIGEKYVQPPVLDYGRIYQQSSPYSPTVFILSPGADPQSDIQLLGEDVGFTGHKFKFLALGQGQGPLAEQMLESGYSRGHWVLLQNCHLLASWLKTLENFLVHMHKPHKDFRLWLTTEPTDKFPLGILQRSLKVVTEPPDGLKQNMRSLYGKIDETMIQECPHPSFRHVIYVLCFLHAVILERRKYGKIGWNVSYDFNESDFNISRRLLSLYLSKAFHAQDEMLPWGSLKYLIGDAMYGGRVSDHYDRRVLTTYLSEYMGNFLFDECQPFYFSRSGYDYCLPCGDDLEANRLAIEDLPLTNSPAVFGLHPNAEIGYYTNASRTIWKDLISLQPRSSATGEGTSREEYIVTINHEILAKVPEAFDVALIKKKINSTPSPTQVVLLQELDRWNALISKMTSSLKDLQKALCGEIGMSEELDALGDSLYNGFLPTMWKRLCPETYKPLGSWMTHFTRRYEQYRDWIENGDPAVIWLSGFGIPESYLTALVQTTCRRKQWPLDKSTLFTQVTEFTSPEQIQARPETGCYVQGLYLEGASWDHQNRQLRKQDPKKLVEELPILQIVPIEASRLKLQNTLKTPVYVTQERRNAMGVGLVFEADLSTLEHSSHWILQGVALCLNIDS